jgi:hypothetical protein
MRLFPIAIIVAASIIALTIFKGGTPLNRARAGEGVEPTAAASPIGRGTPALVATPDLTAVPDLILTLTYNRLDRPVAMSNPPSQIDKGAVYYWLVCIPCHGDRGQGLTDEWREVFGPDEKNCWQSKCHAANHPPDGFSLPHGVPSVLGPGSLQRYKTGAELYHIIQTSMPWYNPDFITADEEWEVTAYLLWKQGVLPREVTIDESNIATFRLGTVAPSKDEERPLTFALAGLLGLVVIGLVWQGRRR